MNSYPSIKQSFGIFGIGLVIMIVASPVYMMIPDQELGFLCHYAIFMAATIYLVIRIRNKTHGTTSFDFSVNDLKIIPWVVIAGAGIMFGLVSPIVSLIPINDFFRKIFIEMAGRTGVFTFVALVIAAPLLEEILFRGIVLDGFLKRYSPLKSILASSLLFGIFHLNPWQFVAAFLLGTLMGWVYYRTRSLALTIIIHSANNLFAFIGMRLTTNYEEIIDQSMIEYYGGVVPFLSVVGISLTALVYAIYELDKRMTIHDWTPKNEDVIVIESRGESETQDVAGN